MDTWYFGDQWWVGPVVGPWLVDREVSSSNLTVVIFEISKSLSEGLSFRLGGGSSLDGAGFTPTLSVVPSGGLCWRFSSHRVDWSVSSSGGSSRAPMPAVVRSSLSQILKLTFQKKKHDTLVGKKYIIIIKQNRRFDPYMSSSFTRLKFDFLI